MWKEQGQRNESTGIGKKDLRQVQSNSSAWRGARDLHQSQAQAAPGINREFCEASLKKRVSIRILGDKLHGTYSRH
jgi:hypothetical protein